MFVIARTTLAFALISLSSTCIASDYFVRPFLNFGGGATIDGLFVNGPTFSDEFFSDASRTGSASADIETAEIKAFAEIDGLSSGFVIASAVMGETFTLRSGAGTDFSFSYYFDGTVTGDAKSIPENPNAYYVEANASIAIFRPGIATWENWFGIANTTDQELYFDRFVYSLTDADQDFDESIGDYFSFQTDLASNHEEFQVFIALNLVISVSTPQFVTLDFSNTGSLFLDTQPEVEVFSASGAFPNTLPVPEPTSGALLLLGGLAVFVARRFRV